MGGTIALSYIDTWSIVAPVLYAGGRIDTKVIGLEKLAPVFFSQGVK